MPLPVVVLAPLIARLRRLTVIAAPLTIIPLVLAARIEAWVPAPSMVIDLLMLIAPKPPGSMALISPPVAVLEIAPAKVLHGAVRLHGLASSPTPETQVRVACACAGRAIKQVRTVAIAVLQLSVAFCMKLPVLCRWLCLALPKVS